jgi:hypothetical protein
MPSRTSHLRWVRSGSLAAILIWCCLLATFATAAGSQPDDWQFDLIHTRNGKVHQGLLVAETPTYVKFWRIFRAPGRQTRRMFSTYETSDIVRIDRLSTDQRRLLQERIRALDPEHEKQCLEKLVLLPIGWGNKAGGGLCYRSEYFILLSDAREEIVRRAAFRLDRMYTALAQFMPPRHVAAPTTIRLVQSQREYQELLSRQGLSFVNPAFYDRDRQEIVSSCDLERLGQELAASQRRNQETRERWLALERSWEKEYRGNIPVKLQMTLNQQLAAVDEACRANERQFEEDSKRFFETLYHEACHAYVSTFVYAKPDNMPCWLQEGLAQIFESAILDGMEFRIGPVDAQRLERFRAASRRGELPGLAQLLRAGPRQFMAGHTREKAATDAYYLSAWALTRYLVFDRELLGTADLDYYVSTLAGGAEPSEAFQQLVGQSLEHFIKSMPTDLRLPLQAGETSSVVGERRP